MQTMKPDIIEELFKKYYNDALLYILSLCKNKTIAEDIVSASFFKALSASDDSIENFKGWLFTVCRNEFLTLCRKRKRFTKIQLSEETAEEAEQLVDRIIRREEYKSLYNAIMILPDIQREVIIMFYFSDFSVKSISEIINKSESNVKVLMHRARKKLKSILEEQL